VHHLSSAMRSSPVAACLPALIDGAQRDPTLRRLHHHYNERRRAALVTAIAAAVEAGQAPADIDPELAAIALAGAVMYRRLMTSRPLRDDEVEPLIATVLGR
jgi:TetR/AcrR family transcriptional regulator of autoinduction and epiphytic fitness